MLSRAVACAALVVASIAAPSWFLPLRAASTPSIELAYDVDPSLESCPSEADVRRAIGRRLGRDPFASAGTLKVIAQVRPSAQGIEGVVTWRGARGDDGERRFSSARHDCTQLLRAMEFSITVHIELLGTSNEGDAPAADAPRPPAAPTSPAEPSRVPRAPAIADPGGRASWSVLAGVGPLAEWGTLPGVSTGGRLFATVRRDALSLELGVEATLPSTWRSDDGSGFRARALVGALAGCNHWGAFSLCAVGKVGRLSVTGFGVDQAASPAGWVGQIGARVAGSFWLGSHVVGSLRVEVVTTPAPWTVQLNRVSVWTTPSIAGLLGIDVAAPIL
jgi:hypothetical protein